MARLADAAMINRMKGQIMNLSRRKFASNLVEKVLIKASTHDATNQTTRRHPPFKSATICTSPVHIM